MIPVTLYIHGEVTVWVKDEDEAPRRAVRWLKDLSAGQPTYDEYPTNVIEWTEVFDE